MSLQNLTLFPRLELIGAPTPLEYLPRLSDYLGREISGCRCAARRGGYPDYRRRYPVQPCAPDGGGGG